MEKRNDCGLWTLLRATPSFPRVFFSFSSKTVDRPLLKKRVWKVTFLPRKEVLGFLKKVKVPPSLISRLWILKTWRLLHFEHSPQQTYFVVERIFSRASKEGCFSSSIQWRYPNNARLLSLFITAKYHTPRIELSPISCLFIWKVERRRSKRKGGNCTHHKRPDSSPACFFSRGSCSSVDGNSWCRSRCRSRRQARKSKGNP